MCAVRGSSRAWSAQRALGPGGPGQVVVASPTAPEVATKAAMIFSGDQLRHAALALCHTRREGLCVHLEDGLVYPVVLFCAVLLSLVAWEEGVG